MLTVSGLLSVLSFIVEQQAKDIGVRMALGATPKNVLGLVLSQSLRPLGIGLVAGGGLAAAPAIGLMASPAASEIGDIVQSSILWRTLRACWLSSLRACWLCRFPPCAPPASIRSRRSERTECVGAAKDNAGMTKPKAAISWSGGKDCCLAMLRAWDSVDIVAMVTMFNEDGGRSRSHGLRPAMVAAHAARLGLEEFSARCSWDTYTDEYIATLSRLPARGITHVVFGDIVGEGHREWNERVCRAHGLTPIMPLWAQPTAQLVREFIALGGEARLVTVTSAASRSLVAGTPVDRRDRASPGIHRCRSLRRIRRVPHDRDRLSALLFAAGRCDRRERPPRRLLGPRHEHRRDRVGLSVDHDELVIRPRQAGQAAREDERLTEQSGRQR